MLLLHVWRVLLCNLLNYQLQSVVMRRMWGVRGLETCNGRWQINFLTTCCVLSQCGELFLCQTLWSHCGLKCSQLLRLTVMMVWCRACTVLDCLCQTTTDNTDMTDQQTSVPVPGTSLCVRPVTDSDSGPPHNGLPWETCHSFQSDHLSSETLIIRHRQPTGV